MREYQPHDGVCHIEWNVTARVLTRRHAVVAVRLYDPVEQELPEFGMAVAQDAETGEQLFVDAHDRGFRQRYAAAAGQLLFLVGNSPNVGYRTVATSGSV